MPAISVHGNVGIDKTLSLIKVFALPFAFALSGPFCGPFYGRANENFSRGENNFQASGHVAKIFRRDEKAPGADPYAVFLFHVRTKIGLVTSIFLHDAMPEAQSLKALGLLRDPDRSRCG